jgi:4-hydroxy-3-methylbut-2-enyl diphosphate reductase
MTSEVLLAEPRGFCAGVDRAIDIVEHALTKFGRPIYVRHEIVHNTYVVNDLKDKGAIFIEELADVPPGATLIFSAHGVSRAIQDEAARRGFRIFDATCPLVSKVHVELAKLHKEGYEFIMIGHKGHPEVEGTMGQLDSGIHLVEDVEDVAKVQPTQTELLAVVTQTTLSVDDAAGIAKGGPDGGCLGPRCAGARSDCPPARHGCGVGAHAGRHSRNHQVPAAQGPEVVTH